MKIAYRRMSGAIGVSDKEQGTRGLWWEKRRALVQFLTQRGHKVDFCSRMTKHSKHIDVVVEIKNHDALIVEFGSSNKSFYKADLEETIKQANEFKGMKIFINDDPDLPFLWNEISGLKNWSCWYNAVRPPVLGKQPVSMPSYDFPFSSLLDAKEPSENFQKDFLVYIGRPGGRNAMMKYLIANKAPWRVFGKQEEWDDFGVFVHPAPNQPQRAEFYSQQLGCLTIADKKHKEMGWRTGRAYHSILAGCPSVVEADHVHLKGFVKFNSIETLNKWFHRWRDPEMRAADLKREVQAMWSDKQIAEATLKKHGI